MAICLFLHVVCLLLHIRADDGLFLLSFREKIHPGVLVDVFHSSGGIVPFIFMEFLPAGISVKRHVDHERISDKFRSDGRFRVSAVAGNCFHHGGLSEYSEAAAKIDGQGKFGPVPQRNIISHIQKSGEI